MNEEWLKDLLKNAEKFMDSQYDCNIAIGDASYKNMDLLTVYKINQLFKSNKISESERNHLLDLQYQKLSLETQLDYAETEKEADSIEQKLNNVCGKLNEHGLNEELSFEYLISSTQANNTEKTIDSHILFAIIRISEILREERGLSLEEATKCINEYGVINQCIGNSEYTEFFLHTDFRTWAERMYNEYTKPEREKIVSSVVAEIMEKQKERETIGSSDTYVNWLKGFMADKESFSDDDWVYNPEEISPDDLKNVGKLYFLLDVIDNYATENNISELSIPSGLYYNVKYNDFMFKVGICVGQGGYCFCEKTTGDENTEFIDFNDVIKSKNDGNAMKRVLSKGESL